MSGQKPFYQQSTVVLECPKTEGRSFHETCSWGGKKERRNFQYYARQRGRHLEATLNANPECAGIPEYPILPKRENELVRKISRDSPKRGSPQRLPTGISI